MPEPDRLSPDRLARLIPGLDPELAGRLAALPSNDGVLAAILQWAARRAGRGRDRGAGGTRRRRRGAACPCASSAERMSRAVGRFLGELRSVDVIDAAAAGHGLVNVDLEGGVVRRMPAVAEVAGLLMPTLAIEMFRVAAEEPVVSVRAGALGVEAVIVGDLAIPTQPDGSVWIHFAHPPPRASCRPPTCCRARQMCGSSRKARARRRDGARHRRLSGHARGRPDGGRRDPRPAHRGHLRRRPALAPVVDRLARSRGARRGGRDPDPRAARPARGCLDRDRRGPRRGDDGARARLYFGGRILFDAAVPIIGIGALFTAMLGTTLAEAQGQRRALRRQMARQREIARAPRRRARGGAPHPDGQPARPRPAPSPARRASISTRFLEPAREVGGDLYDFFRLDADRIFLLVGDVSGKGLPGSLFMAMSKSLCKSIALRDHGDVGSVMREADREISGTTRRAFSSPSGRASSTRRPARSSTAMPATTPRIFCSPAGRPADSPRAADRRSASSTSFPTRPRATGCAEGRSSAW